MSCNLRRVLLFVCGALLYLLGTCGRQHPGTKIEWLTDLDSALSLAANLDKPVMIDFMATWCPPCKAMEESTFSQAGIIERSSYFIPVRIDVDLQPEIANRYKSNARKYGGIGIPNMLFLTAEEDTLAHIIGYYPPDRLAAVLDSVITLFQRRK